MAPLVTQRIKKMSEEKSKLTVVGNTDNRDAVLRKRFSQMGSGEWGYTENLLLEIQALDYITCGGDPSKQSSIREMVESLKATISRDLKDDQELKEFVLNTLPTTDEAFRLWTKKSEWNESLISKIRSHHTFSPFKKLAMLDALYEKGKVKGDVRAMELYFKLAGDLTTEKKGSKELDDYRNYNRIINTPRK